MAAAALLGQPGQVQRYSGGLAAWPTFLLAASTEAILTASYEYNEVVIYT